MATGEHSVSEMYESVPGAVPRARKRVGEFAALCGVAGPQLQAVRLAVSEAVTNVVRHAYRGVAGRIHVTAARLPGEFVVLVGDQGCGYRRPPVDPGFGWGLALIADAADDFVIAERSDGGTEIRMRFVLADAAAAVDTAARDAQRGSVDSATAPA